MKRVLYNRVNADVGFDRANGTRVRLGPRDSSNDHVVLEEHEAELPGVVGLLRSRRTMLLTLEQSRQFEDQRGRRAPAAPDKKAEADAKAKAEEEAKAKAEEEAKAKAKAAAEAEAEADADDDGDDAPKSGKGRKKKKNRG